MPAARLTQRSRGASDGNQASDTAFAQTCLRVGRQAMWKEASSLPLAMRLRAGQLTRTTPTASDRYRIVPTASAMGRSQARTGKRLFGIC